MRKNYQTFLHLSCAAPAQIIHSLVLSRISVKFSRLIYIIYSFQLDLFRGAHNFIRNINKHWSEIPNSTAATAIDEWKMKLYFYILQIVTIVEIHIYWKIFLSILWMRKSLEIKIENCCITTHCLYLWPYSEIIFSSKTYINRIYSYSLITFYLNEIVNGHFIMEIF